MTDLRKAADMAHEALVMWEQLDPHHSLNVVRAPAINALAEALAQPDEVAAEREACARMCEEIEEPSFQLQEPNLKFRYKYRRAVLNCAAAIRARGEA